MKSVAVRIAIGVFALGLKFAPSAEASKLSACSLVLLDPPADTAAEVELRVINKDSSIPKRDANGIMELTDYPPESAGEPADVGSGVAESRQWRDLPLDLQLQRLNRAGGSRFRFIRGNREIPGLHVATMQVLKWHEPVNFLGVQYEADREYEVDIAPLVPNNYVEYGEITDVGDVRLMEFHFRARLWPSRLLHEVFTLLAGKGINKGNLHIHAPGPAERIMEKRKAMERAFLMVEMWRRLNLAAHLISIHDKGIGVRDHYIDSGLLPTLMVIRKEDLREMYYDLVRYFTSGKEPRSLPPDKFKRFYVGFHFPSKYDGTSPLFGYQFRTVAKAQAGPFGQIMDYAVASLQERRFGAEQFLEGLKARNLSIEELNQELLEAIDSLWPMARRHAGDTTAARLVENDWSRDPVLGSGQIAAGPGAISVKELYMRVLDSLSFAGQIVVQPPLRLGAPQYH
jgi:hypothetical protein